MNDKYGSLQIDKTRASLQDTVEYVISIYTSGLNFVQVYTVDFI